MDHGRLSKFNLDILTKLQFGTERQPRQCNDRTWIWYICYFKIKFVMCGISSHSSWWQQEFSGWHNPLDCYDKETFNTSILCWTYHFYCRENLLTNEHLLFLLWLLIRVIFWQTDDIFHVACFQYWGRVDLSQKIVSKKLSLPLFPRYVAKIKKINWPTVQKVG